MVLVVKGVISKLRPFLPTGVQYGDGKDVDMSPVTVRSGEYTDPEEFLERVRATYKEHGYVFFQEGSVIRSNT